VTVLVGVLHIGIAYLPLPHDVFGTVPLSPERFVAPVAAGLLVLGATELAKWLAHPEFAR